MSEHKAVAVIPGDPDAVFAYLADVHKLSTYLPMVTSAMRTGREDATIRMQVGGVFVTITLETDHHSDAVFQRAMEAAASALRAIRGAEAQQ